MNLDIQRALQLGLSSELRWLMMGDPCPYCCRGILNSHVHNPIVPIPETSYFAFPGPKQHLKFCLHCGWWIIEEYTNTQHQGIFAKLLDFTDADYSLPVESLQAYIARHGTKFECISSRAFEKIAASVISDHFQCEVRLTGYSKDNGVDMYAVISDRPWAFQFKRRLSNEPEGIEEVREFLGALVENSVPCGLYLTTAPRFTRGAIRLSTSDSVRSKGYQIQLVNGNDFRAMFNLAFRNSQHGWTKHWGGDPETVFGEIAESGLSFPYP